MSLSFKGCRSRDVLVVVFKGLCWDVVQRKGMPFKGKGCRSKERDVVQRGCCRSEGIAQRERDRSKGMLSFSDDTGTSLCLRLSPGLSSVMNVQRERDRIVQRERDRIVLNNIRPIQ